MEAIKATPREFIDDSLTKHVPLQGTAVVPPGMADMRGHVMSYEEGADLMREKDAPGGAYKRWDFVVSDLPTDVDSLGADRGSLTTPTILRGKASHLSRWTGIAGSTKPACARPAAMITLLSRTSSRSSSGRLPSLPRMETSECGNAAPVALPSPGRRHVPVP